MLERWQPAQDLMIVVTLIAGSNKRLVWLRWSGGTLYSFSDSSPKELLIQILDKLQLIKDTGIGSASFFHFTKLSSFSSLFPILFSFLIVFWNNKKFVIDGKDIEVTGQKKRVGEIVLLAVKKGFDIPEKSVRHYAKGRGGIEYVLVRWWILKKYCRLFAHHDNTVCGYFSDGLWPLSLRTSFIIKFKILLTSISVYTICCITTI